MKKHTKARLEGAIIDYLTKHSGYVYVGHRTALITTAVAEQIDVRGVKTPSRIGDDC